MSSGIPIAISSAYVVYALIVISAIVASPIVRVYVSMHSWMHILFNIMVIAAIALVLFYDCETAGTCASPTRSIIAVLIVLALLYQIVVIFFVHSKYNVVALDTSASDERPKLVDGDDNDDYDGDDAEESAEKQLEADRAAERNREQQHIPPRDCAVQQSATSAAAVPEGLDAGGVAGVIEFAEA